MKFFQSLARAVSMTRYIKALDKKPVLEGPQNQFSLDVEAAWCAGRSDGETASYKSSQQKQATLAALQGGVGFIVWFHCGKKVLGALTRYTLSQADIHPCSCTISEPVSKTWPCTWRLGLWLQGCFSRFQQKELDFLGVSCATAIDPVMKNIPYHCSLLFTCHKPCRICAAVLLPAVTLFASVATHAPHAPLHAIVSSQESCQDGESQWGSRQKYVR